MGDGEPREDDFEALLVAYHDAQVAGSEAVARVLAQVPAHWMPRFLNRCKSLDLLESVLPRSRDDTAEGATSPGEPTPATALPQKFGRFVVDRVLGRGGFATVYLAEDPAISRKVAVKVPDRADPALLQRFRSEALTAAKMDHPNVIGILELSAEGAVPYIVMDYCPGTNLDRWLGRWRETSGQAPPVPLREAAEIVRTLARAVHYIHSWGIIHRDLKPANVLLQGEFDENGPLPPLAQFIPRITDFGLAKDLARVGEETGRGVQIGTPRYLAPEQADGRQGPIRTPADIHALGLILYELLTGRPAFDADTTWKLQQQVLEEAPPRPSRFVGRRALPFDLETICLKCLNKHPKDRYSSAEALDDDLGRFLDGKPIQARRTPFWERGRMWARRRPAVAGLLALLGAALALGVPALIWEARKADDQAAKAGAEAFGRLLDAAQTDLDRGRLTQARERYDKALATAPAGRRREIEVKRLRCLFAYGHWQELQKELERLTGRDDLPDQLRAQVLLFGGDLTLWEAAAEKQKAGRELVRAALKVPDGLSDADAAYARGLLDDGTFDAVRHFKEAVGHDPFHLRANAALLMELVLSGQFEKADRRAEVMDAAFPDEPVTPLARALMATLKEDGPARAGHLDELRRRVGDPRRMEGINAAFAALDKAIRANHLLHGPKKATDWLAWLTGGRPPQLVPPGGDFGGLASGLRQLGEPGLPKVVGVGLPVLRRPARMVEEFADAHKALRDGNAADAATRLEEAERRYPESLLLLTDANAQLTLSQQLASRGDMVGSAREGRRAYELAERAAIAPTLLPFGPYRHNADWLCALIGVSWRAGHRSDAAQLAVATLAPAVNPLGTAATLAAGRERLAVYPVEKDRAHLLRAAASGGDYDEARSDMIPRLMPYFEDDDARRVLLPWVRAAPGDPLPFRLLAPFELSRGNYGTALRWAEQGLTLSPRDKKLLQARDRAKKALEPASR